MPQVPMVDPKTGFPTIPWYQYFVSPLIADINLSGATTDDLAQGETNLYFSNALSFAALKDQLQQGQNISLQVNEQAQTITISATGQAFVADNTAQIGLTRVEGVSPFGMRADAAPPLNQAISPTWTGNHTFSNIVTASVTGNAATATALQTARTISGVSFNGTANIVIPFSGISSTPTTLAGYGITNGVTNTTQVIAGTGLGGGGALSANVTLSLASQAASTLLGVSSTGAGIPTAITLGTNLSMSAGGVLSASGGGGSGTVTSVALTAPGIFAVGGSPVTTSGTLAITLSNQNANLVWAGPATGSAAAPTFRSLVAADIPSLAYVTSVGLSLPSIFTVSGSPVTSTGTLTATLATQTANTFWMGPSSGAAASPTFRAPVLSDIGVALPNGYIDGLVLSWNSATSISVSSGNAFIPNGTFINVSSTLTISGLSLSASTFYHVYLFNNSGTPAIECVTTAPAASYSGVSRAKTGDTSRRYLGSVVTDGSSNILKFQHDSEHGLILYISAVTNNLVVTGNATTPTTVSCSSYVPVTGILVRMFMLNAAAATGTPVLLYANSNLSGALSATNYHGFVYPQTCMMADVSLDSSQAFQYAFSAAPSSGNFFGRVAGYIFGR